MSKNIKKWLFIVKWLMYVDVVVIGLSIFSEYDRLPGYVFVYSFILLFVILEVYIIIKSRSKSKKIVCTYCRQEIIQLPISPVTFIYRLIKFRHIPDKYIWAHFRSESIYCQTTRAEPEGEQ